MKAWFLWWVSVMRFESGKWIDRGTWYGPKYLTDREVWREQFDIVKSNLGATPYRLRWDGEQWLYDNRTDNQLIASGQPF